MPNKKSVVPMATDTLAAHTRTFLRSLRELTVEPIAQYMAATEEERRNAGNEEKSLIAAYDKALALSSIADEIKLLGGPLGHVPLVGRVLKFGPTGASILIKRQVKKRKAAIAASSNRPGMSNLRRHVQMHTPRDAAAALSEVQSWSKEFMRNMLYYKRFSERILEEVERRYGKDVAREIRADSSR